MNGFKLGGLIWQGSKHINTVPNNRRTLEPALMMRGKNLTIGMRKHVCSKNDQRTIFLDHFSEIVFTLIALILVFNLLDAFLTLVLIDHGATELNPLMAFYQNIGPATFVAVKYGMTSLSIFVLLVSSHNSTKRMNIKTPTFFLIILFAVAGVIPWQLYLIFRNF